MNLFVESRLSHLKKDPASADFELAQQLENNIRLAFNQLIVKRNVDSTNAILNNNRPRNINAVIAPGVSTVAPITTN